MRRWQRDGGSSRRDGLQAAADGDGSDRVRGSLGRDSTSRSLGRDSTSRSLGRDPTRWRGARVAAALTSLSVVSDAGSCWRCGRLLRSRCGLGPSLSRCAGACLTGRGHSLESSDHPACRRAQARAGCCASGGRCAACGCGACPRWMRRLGRARGCGRGRGGGQNAVLSRAYLMAMRASVDGPDEARAAAAAV